MNRVKSSPAILTLILCGMLSFSAAAWGPRAQTTIVLAAAHMLSKENAVPLTRLIDHIRAGADVPPNVLQTLLPDAERDPIRSIQDEMALLQSVQGESVDPYLAYRLGVLGKVVARLTAPLLTADPRYKNLYDADVENAISGVSLKAFPRREVDPIVYFPAVQQEAASRSQVIEKEYQAGVGFRGVAGQSLSQEVSRSVNAVADVWYTILRRQAAVVSVSDSRVKEYYVNALEYYLARRNPNAVTTVYDKLVSLGAQTPEMRKRIADMFYEAEQYDRAIEEYRAVLSEQPGRRDVVQRISEYFKKRGDEASKSGRLEAARDAYKQAAEADKLDEKAQELLIEAERRITDREERRKAAQTALENAFAAEKDAENLLRQSNFSGAIGRLTEAEQLYASVTDEFPEERRAAQNGINNVVKRKNQLKDELLRNAQNFSGSGSSLDIFTEIKLQQEDLARESILEVLEQERNAAVRALAAEKKASVATSITTMKP